MHELCIVYHLFDTSISMEVGMTSLIVLDPESIPHISLVNKEIYTRLVSASWFLTFQAAPSQSLCISATFADLWT